MKRESRHERKWIPRRLDYKIGDASPAGGSLVPFEERHDSFLLALLNRDLVLTGIRGR